MKRKLRRVTQPNILFFFPVLIFFALAAFFVRQYFLGICELLFTAGLYALYCSMAVAGYLRWRRVMKAEKQ